MLEKLLPVAMLGKPLSVVGGIPMNFEGAAQHSWAMLGKALPMWSIFPEGVDQHSWAMPGKPLPMVGSILRRCRPAMLGKPLSMVANILRRCRSALMSHARETSTNGSQYFQKVPTSHARETSIKISINDRQYSQKMSIDTHELCSKILYQWWAIFLFSLNHVRIEIAFLQHHFRRREMSRRRRLSRRISMNLKRELSVTCNDSINLSSIALTFII